ncbi:DUF2955 domain-containing protein [Lysobacter sp. TAF61]|uniref:DUF2955 domain-containing protein n=1 Tax=Lysobacter sp. TAF61 TaxID=3233072 RepID=UPI003F9E497D
MSIDAAHLPSRTALTEDSWRHARRIAIASVLGLATAKLMGWPYGAFFAFYPIVLVGLVRPLNPGVVLQFVGSSAVSILVAQVLIILSDVAPLLAVLAFFAFAAHCFRMMALERWVLFHALAILSTSVLAHLASYPQVAPDDLYTAQFIATVLAVVVSGFTHAVLPERRSSTPEPRAKPPAIVHHQMLLGAICATVSYVAFQLLDLRDSLSAQAASVLVLFPMTLSGGRWAACTRVIGTLLGSLYALTLQVVLYTHASHVPLLLTLYAAGVTWFATWHVREDAGPAVGLSAATAVAVLIGQLVPSADLYGISLYRFVSVAIAVTTMLLCIYLTQAALNSFAATRLDQAKEFVANGPQSTPSYDLQDQGAGVASSCPQLPRKVIQMEEHVIVDSSFTAIINAPIEKIDIPSWCFSLPDKEYQGCSPAHFAAGATTSEDGRRMSINVEVLGGVPMVQHYVEQIAEPHRLVLDSVSDLFTPSGRTTILVMWELSVEPLDAGRCTFTNHVRSRATEGFLDYLARQGIPFELFRDQRKPISTAHNKQETPFFAASIERYALRAARQG